MSMIESKVKLLLEKLPQVQEELGSIDYAQEPKRYKELSQRYSYLEKLQESYRIYTQTLQQIDDGKAMLRELQSDDSMYEELESEILSLEERVDTRIGLLQEALIPPSAEDDASTIMELRAGTGGDEAAIFVGDCVRMYQLYADEKGWKYEVLSQTLSDMGGYKEYCMVISGAEAYKILQYEGGTHRVQRVPATESQGRVHTSAITIAVMPELEEEEEIKIDDKELRIDTMRSSGAGGQHVNTTDSAVRITHLPTGIVVYCQQERSQIKNREKAMRVLHAKLTEVRRMEKQNEQSQLRSSQVGSGDRSERIRTYNFPQNRVTDHRINLTLYSLDAVINGNLGLLTAPLVLHFRQKQLEDIK